MSKALPDWLAKGEYLLATNTDLERDLLVTHLRFELRALGIFESRPDPRTELYERSFCLALSLLANIHIMQRSHDYLLASGLPQRILADLDKMESLGLLLRREMEKGYELRPSATLVDLVRFCEPSDLEVIRA